VRSHATLWRASYRRNNIYNNCYHYCCCHHYSCCPYPYYSYNNTPTTLSDNDQDHYQDRKHDCDDYYSGAFYDYSLCSCSCFCHASLRNLFARPRLCLEFTSPVGFRNEPGGSPTATPCGGEL